MLICFVQELWLIDVICVIHFSLYKVYCFNTDHVYIYRRFLRNKKTSAENLKYLKNSKSFLDTLYTLSIPSASAMPQQPDALAVQGYVDAFAGEPHLLGVGFSFLIDITGTLFKKKKPSLKDMNGNTQA